MMPTDSVSNTQHGSANETEVKNDQKQTQQPLRPAMVLGRRRSDAEGKNEAESSNTRGSVSKVVSIVEQPETIAPTSTPHLLEPQPLKQFSAGVAKRLSGRPTSANSSSKVSLKSQTSFEDLPAAALARLTDSTKHHKSHHQHQKFLGQVSDWIQSQKAKSAARKERRGRRGKKTSRHVDHNETNETDTTEKASEDSDSSAISLGDLEKILAESMSLHDKQRTPAGSPKLGPRRPSYGSRKRPSSRRMSKVVSSDTEYFDGEVLVPSCDVVLDNSKTLSYGGGGASSSDLNLPTTGKKAEKEAKAWDTFKSEILRLAHTLRLKGWRRVPLENGHEIEVTRLSGALTNAVYVVSPPKNMPQPEDGKKPKKPPAKLLLRIYGPQVEHLIDREAELGILRRLARKKIGPRLLGTFRNGRFEEYFASTTLTPDDLRIPETSKQIAKRMRELHDGIELLESEVNDGPFVLRNWDKWVERCEHVIKFLDHQIAEETVRGVRADSDEWKKRGYVCGVEWSVFRKQVDECRKWLYEQYGGYEKLKQNLVFAHNDTQYGNILRLLPSTESPLLQPENSHKQLIVIDFEYASANTRGLEFANHFTEWCYNYADPVKSYACNTKAYPTPEEQRRFIRAYLNHRPQFVASASATPKARPSLAEGTTGISAFMLDARVPGTATPNYQEEERLREEQLEKDVEELYNETRWWRLANSAQWVAWGIVQANVPELDEADKASNSGSTVSPGSTTPRGTGDVSPTSQEPGLPHEQPGGIEEPIPEKQVTDVEVDGANESQEGEKKADGDEEEEEEFDYLLYAQDRALFFWGDCVDLGLVKREDLPTNLRDRIKVLGY